MTGGVTISVVGADELEKKLDAAGDRAVQALGAAVFATANNIMADAARRAPVDLGNLRASGYVSLPEVDGTRVEVEIGFGGPSAPYALIQHEMPYHHDEGEMKYLERAVAAEAPKITQHVATALRRALAGETTPGVVPTAPVKPQ